MKLLCVFLYSIFLNAAASYDVIWGVNEQINNIEFFDVEQFDTANKMLDAVGLINLPTKGIESALFDRANFDNIQHDNSRRKLIHDRPISRNLAYKLDLKKVDSQSEIKHNIPSLGKQSDSELDSMAESNNGFSQDDINQALAFSMMDQTQILTAQHKVAGQEHNEKEGQDFETAVASKTNNQNINSGSAIGAEKFTKAFHSSIQPKKVSGKLNDHKNASGLDFQSQLNDMASNFEKLRTGEISYIMGPLGYTQTQTIDQNQNSRILWIKHPYIDQYDAVPIVKFYNKEKIEPMINPDMKVLTESDLEKKYFEGSLKEILNANEIKSHVINLNYEGNNISITLIPIYVWNNLQIIMNTQDTNNANNYSNNSGSSKLQTRVKDLLAPPPARP